MEHGAESCRAGAAAAAPTRPPSSSSFISAVMCMPQASGDEFILMLGLRSSSRRAAPSRLCTTASNRGVNPKMFRQFTSDPLSSSRSRTCATHDHHEGVGCKPSH